MPHVEVQFLDHSRARMIVPANNVKDFNFDVWKNSTKNQCDMKKKKWKVLFTWKPEFEEKFDAASFGQYYDAIILRVGGKSLNNNTLRKKNI